MNQPCLLPGLGPVINSYRGLILDLWGVVHNGIRPYPGVIEALTRLRADSRRVCLLSNAPRRAADVAARLIELGIGCDLYDALVTSGESVVSALADPPDPWHAALGPRFLHLGPPDGFGLLAAIARRPVEDPDEADFVLATGTAPGRDVSTFETTMTRCAGRGLPLLCANPDLKVIIGDQVVPCAGALAARYEQLGGKVHHHGKPYPAVYRRALALLGLPPSAVLAVGDTLRTDIAGAAGVGLDAALVTGGLHLEELGGHWGAMPDPQKLEALLAASPHAPAVVVPAFAL